MGHPLVKPVKSKMQEAVELAGKYGYEVHSHGGNGDNYYLVKSGNERPSLGLALDRASNGAITATVQYLPPIGMVRVVGMSCSFPHPNFLRMFEAPVMRLAILFEATLLLP